MKTPPRFKNPLILMTPLFVTLCLTMGADASSSQQKTSLGLNQLTFNSIRLPGAHGLMKVLNIVPAPVTVAVIDSGVSVFHPMFQGKIVVNPLEIPGNRRDDDQNGLEDDYYGYDFTQKIPFMIDPDGHGTHVAGIITQVNPQARILSIRVLDSQGNGKAEDIVAAIKYAVDRGAKVINLSLGGADRLARTQNAYEEAIRYARNRDVLVLSAAGNDYGSNNDSHAFFPANTWDDNAMSICSNDLSGNLSKFSNYGKFRVHLCAPGENIVSANAHYNPLSGNKALYVAQSGTSQATPIISGVASIIYGLRPELKAYQVRNILMGHIFQSEALRGKSLTGGYINVENAVWSTIHGERF